MYPWSARQRGGIVEIAMQVADVIIIGGGPAGSTCAGKLAQGGLDVLIVDKAEFPRSKLCSGWITPGVIDDLKLDVEDYCRGRVFQPMSGFCIGQIGGEPSGEGRLRPNRSATASSAASSTIISCGAAGPDWRWAKR